MAQKEIRATKEKDGRKSQEEMKWLLLILFPLQLFSQEGDTIDWYKFPSAEFPYPPNTTGFQLVMQPLTVPVDMEIQKKYKASSGNWITGTVFPAFFSRPGLLQEVFTVSNVNVSDTFFIKFFTPQSDSCGEYKFRVNTW